MGSSERGRGALEGSGNSVCDSPVKRSSGCAEAEADGARGNVGEGCGSDHRHRAPPLVSVALEDGRSRTRVSNELTRVQSAAMSIPVERCIVSRDLTEPRLSPDGRCIVYAMAAGGSAALMIDMLDGSPVRQLTAYPAPRPGRGFGGGCWCWCGRRLGGDLRRASMATSGCNRCRLGQMRRLTDLEPKRTAAAPVAVADGSRVVYVVDESELWSVAWRRWLRPNASTTALPTSCSTLLVARRQQRRLAGVERTAHAVGQVADRAGRVRRPAQRIAAQPLGAVQQVRFMPDGAELCLRDDGGWLNVWLDGTPLHRRAVRARRADVGHGPAIVRRRRPTVSGSRSRATSTASVACASSTSAAEPSARLRAVCMGSCRGTGAGLPPCDRARSHRRRSSSTTTPRGNETSSRSGR